VKEPLRPRDENFEEEGGGGGRNLWGPVEPRKENSLEFSNLIPYHLVQPKILEGLFIKHEPGRFIHKSWDELNDNSYGCAINAINIHTKSKGMCECFVSFFFTDVARIEMIAASLKLLYTQWLCALHERVDYLE
jgi:hypothetical protein